MRHESGWVLAIRRGAISRSKGTGARTSMVLVIVVPAVLKRVGARARRHEAESESGRRSAPPSRSHVLGSGVIQPPDQDYLEVVHRVGDHLLEALVSVCRAHHIPFYVHAGTLLGTIREAGWIPWDDDVDVVMFRGDYERFRTVCGAALPPGLLFSDARSQQHHLSSIPKVLYENSERLKEGRPRRFRPLESRHLGLDVFILDTAPRHAWGRRAWRLAIRLSERLLVARAMNVRHALMSEETPHFVTLGAVMLSRLLSLAGWKQVHLALCTAPGRLRSGPLYCVANDFKPRFRAIVMHRDLFLPAREARFGRTVVPVPARAEEVLAKMYGATWRQPPDNSADRQPIHLQEGVSVGLDGTTWSFAPPRGDNIPLLRHVDDHDGEDPEAPLPRTPRGLPS